ncbi:MAG: extracellular solute-binding protein, partial [Anaerolineales bacterium]|nr:extracellular solute-binding protein [Anaerolineales bacterium]
MRGFSAVILHPFRTMGDQFDWQSDTHLAPSSHNDTPLRPVVTWEPLRFWLGAALVLALLLGGWGIGRFRVAQAAQARQTAVQTRLDQERQAFLAGDGAGFMAFLADDPAWQAAQLLPHNQAAQRAGLQVTDVRLFGGTPEAGGALGANVSWTVNGQTYQRITFFRQSAGQLLHVPTAPEFWGARQERETTWGTLVYHEADALFADRIVAAVTDAVIAACEARCVANRLPLTLVLRDDFVETAVPNTLHLPSPRIVAVAANGQPAAPFWAELQARVTAHLVPATIRFALPPQNFLGLHYFDYEQAAADFMALHPDVTVELVTLPELPADPRVLAAYDGAAFVPPPELVAAGLVRDLTDLAATDPDFQPGDFYDQVWQGAQWQERMWLMPQAAAMKLVYFDRATFAQAGLAEPSLR